MKPVMAILTMMAALYVPAEHCSAITSIDSETKVSDVVGEEVGILVDLPSGRRARALGDILIPDGEHRSAPIGAQWDGGVFYYSIHSSFTPSEMNVIRALLLELNGFAGVKTIEGGSSGDRAIFYRVTNPNICGSSFIGRQGGIQDILIDVNCINRRTVQHETLHALGFVHEHQREDRNHFINVEHSNSDCSSYSTLGRAGSYDFHSIMHYRRFDCGGIEAIQIQPAGSPDSALPGCATIEECMAAMGATQLSQRDRLGLQVYYGHHVTIAVSGPGSYSVGGQQAGCLTNCFHVNRGQIFRIIGLPQPGYRAIVDGAANQAAYLVEQNRTVQLNFVEVPIHTNGFE